MVLWRGEGTWLTHTCTCTHTRTYRPISSLQQIISVICQRGCHATCGELKCIINCTRGKITMNFHRIKSKENWIIISDIAASVEANQPTDQLSNRKATAAHTSSMWQSEYVFAVCPLPECISIKIQHSTINAMKLASPSRQTAVEQQKCSRNAEKTTKT